MKNFPRLTKIVAAQTGINMDFNILMVEDDIVYVEKFKSLYSDNTLTCAFNGMEGIDILKKRSFDFVILDYILPDMDASEMVRRLNDEHIYFSYFIITNTSGLYIDDINCVGILNKRNINWRDLKKIIHHNMMKS